MRLYAGKQLTENTFAVHGCFFLLGEQPVGADPDPFYSFVSRFSIWEFLFNIFFLRFIGSFPGPTNSFSFFGFTAGIFKESIVSLIF